MDDLINKVMPSLVTIFASLYLLQLILKPLMDLMEYRSFGMLFENQTVPERLKKNKWFISFRYLLNLFTGIRL